VEHFLRDSNKRISAEAMQALIAYDWPGNVRELDNEIKKLVLLAGVSETIPADILSTKIVADSRAKTALSGQPDSALVGAMEFGEQYSLYDYLARHERQFIVKALKERNGVKKQD
jgi:DNA-binding NtrC family response regulator